jgi:hypothetical protein
VGDARGYQDALAELSVVDALARAQAGGDGAEATPGAVTIRVYLAGWFREQIAQGEVVRVDLRVCARASGGAAVVCVASGHPSRQL